MTLLPQPNNEILSAVSASFDPQTGIVQVHLDKVSYGYVDQPLRYQDIVLQPKNELHITLVSQDASGLIKHLESHPDDLDDIQDLVSSATWTYRKHGKYFFVEEEPGVETIIETVDVPELVQFLKDLSKLVGHGFILPPTHVTLYTRGTEKGISLPNQAVFDQMVKAQIQPEQVRSLEGGPSLTRKKG